MPRKDIKEKDFKTSQKGVKPNCHGKVSKADTVTLLQKQLNNLENRLESEKKSKPIDHKIIQKIEQSIDDVKGTLRRLDEESQNKFSQNHPGVIGIGAQTMLR
jgi:hypothetical protein